MSEERNNIDQLFNDAAHHQKAPEYNSSYWSEMNAFLNARDAKRKGLFLWTAVGTVLCLILVGTLFVINTTGADARVQYAQTNLELKTNRIVPIKGDFDNISKANLDNNTNNLNSERNYNQILNETSKGVNQGAKNVVSSKKLMLNRPILTNKASETTKIVTQETRVPSEKVVLDKEVTIDKVSNDVDRANTDALHLSLPLREINQITQNAPGHLPDTKVKQTSRTQYSLYAKVSGGLMENYKTGSPYQSGLTDLSLNLEARFNSVILRTGIGTQYTTHADLVVSQRAKVYGFGLVRQQNDLSYQDLLDVYIPIELGYQLNKTSFGFGVQANYLLTTRMNLNVYENQVLTTTEKYYGNKNGLRDFSTQGYVWMEQRILPKFSMGLKIGTNISGRIKDGKYFNQSATINPIYGQLTFRLNIL